MDIGLPRQFETGTKWLQELMNQSRPGKVRFPERKAAMLGAGRGLPPESPDKSHQNLPRWWPN